MAQKRMSGEERRTQIITVAAQIFSKQGFTSTTTKEIAHAADINEAVIYRHFRSKEELYDAAIDFYIDEVQKLYTGVISAPLALEELLYAVGCRVLNFTNANVHLTRMMLFSGLEDHRASDRFLAAVTSRIINLIIERFAIEQKKGTIRNDIEPRLCALQFVGTMLFFNIARNVMHAPMIQGIEVETYVRSQLTIFMDGIRIDK